MMIQGIDVSVHNGEINWPGVANLVDFAIIRAGYGKSAQQKDKKYEANYLACKQNGIPVGAYWYSYAKNAKEALEEAKAFEQVLYGKQFDLPIFLDIEEKESMPRAGEIVDTFCSYLESKGYYVGVYCSKYYLNTYLNNITARYAGWVAQWAEKCTYSQPYILWQKTDKGRVEGISGYVDLDEFYDEETFNRVQRYIHENGLNGFEKPTTEQPEKDRVQVYINGKCVYDSLLSS